MALSSGTSAMLAASHEAACIPQEPHGTLVVKNGFLTVAWVEKGTVCRCMSEPCLKVNGASANITSLAYATETPCRYNAETPWSYHCDPKSVEEYSWEWSEYVLAHHLLRGTSELRTQGSSHNARDFKNLGLDKRMTPQRLPAHVLLKAETMDPNAAPTDGLKVNTVSGEKATVTLGKRRCRPTKYKRQMYRDLVSRIEEQVEAGADISADDVKIPGFVTENETLMLKFGKRLARMKAAVNADPVY